MARLLLIDDDSQFRTMLRRTLERAGHSVVDAEDGPRGMQAFGEHPADLAIVDLYMPGRSGWETIRLLHACAPDLPFVIVTGGGAMEPVANGEVPILASLYASGAVEILRKPFEREVLIDAVNTLLARREDAARD